MSEMEAMELLPSMASGFEFHRYRNGNEFQVLQSGVSFLGPSQIDQTRKVSEEAEAPP
jgi:hypothetical protein